MGSLYVINAKGEREPLSFRKIYRSARQVGAPAPLAEKIAKTIKDEAYPGIKTSEIFKKAKKLLSKEIPEAALKFNLKEGMRRLGPTGFPFEKYIGEILKRFDFKVQLNQYIPGACAKYEIDFLAKNENILYIGECKYHNLAGKRVDLKVILANYARFLDLRRGSFFKKNKIKNLKLKTLVVTNTKFTSQAIHYSQCQGVELLGWKYPKDKGLELLIDEHKLYPITILPSLRGNLINFFVSKRMMLAKDVLKVDPVKFTKETKIPRKYLNPLIKEARVLLRE